jgi:hypothetical protein
MKPRIRKDAMYFGLWACQLPGTLTAIGYSPDIAYRRWAKVNRIKP